MEKRLYRIKSSKMLGGVAAGLAEYFDIDVTLVRVLFVVAFFAPIPSVIPYIVLWMIMPTKESIMRENNIIINS
ncbi:PspC domain-containing protein [Emticicia sp. 21SJ11W-3]|uniref:PspC domain-containing protein n=1 Tax=Emticicia sp. 21SJ11W-3 TaxID=2916755 RepID=UPI00209E0881|nr:PspC domain-containing protein [Emticicia sp. 21SJ11W-3]UTA69959.1 PspC domain-containing protein [Emticicia sp. 21SJ11W-3]